MRSKRAEQRLIFASLATAVVAAWLASSLFGMKSPFLGGAFYGTLIFASAYLLAELLRSAHELLSKPIAQVLTFAGLGSSVVHDAYVAGLLGVGPSPGKLLPQGEYRRMEGDTKHVKEVLAFGWRPRCLLFKLVADSGGASPAPCTPKPSSLANAPWELSQFNGSSA